MPPKIRNKTGVSLSARTIRQFEDDVSAMWDKFEQGVAEKVDAYRKEYCERRGITEDQMLPEDHMAVQGKEEEIRTAEAIVKYGIFRHCGAVAKTEAAIELASSILDGHKLVIFTSFIDVAKDIAERIKKETGHETAVISAEVTGKSRDAIREDFQNPEGSIQCIVCTAAAGEAITLTAADYMIIVDRLFRPGDVVQWEGRIDRIGQKQRIVIYWLQLPVNVTNIDDKIDALLEQKQVNIDKAILGKSPDEDTQFEKQNGKTLEALMRETVTRIRNK